MEGFEEKVPRELPGVGSESGSLGINRDRSPLSLRVPLFPNDMDSPPLQQKTQKISQQSAVARMSRDIAA